MTLFDEYGAYHRDPRNRLCHEIGIPLIVLALESLTRLVPLGPYSLATLLTLGVSAYYLYLVRAQAAAAIVGLVVLYYVSAFIPWQLAIAAFVVGWILQFVGHAFEGQRPAFLTNFVHLLVGPLWIAHLATRPRAS